MSLFGFINSLFSKKKEVPPVINVNLVLKGVNARIENAEAIELDAVNIVEAAKEVKAKPRKKPASYKKTDFDWKSVTQQICEMDIGDRIVVSCAKYPRSLERAQHRVGTIALRVFGKGKYRTRQISGKKIVVYRLG